MADSTESFYEKRGASATKEDVKQALEGLRAGLFPGAFCKAVSDTLTGSPEHCVISHSDGAGTKSALAYLHYQRHGRADIFTGIAQDSLVMNIDDMLCVGAIGPFIYSNTIGRNSKRVPGAVIRAIIHGYEDFAQSLAPYGIELTACGGETADIGDLVRTLVVDSSVTARLKRSDFINCNSVRTGSLIIGLASFGRASYESCETTGIATNGFTALRHALLSQKYRSESPETYAPEIAQLAYTGTCDIDDPLPGTQLTIGEALLSPTRTYAPVVLRILEHCRPAISAMFHNTGGAQTKCVNFGENVRYVKDNLFTPPPVFQFIVERCGMPSREIYQTFNMGHRLEIVCDPQAASEVVALSGSAGIAAQIVGRVEKATGRSLVIEARGETHVYGNS